MFCCPPVAFQGGLARSGAAPSVPLRDMSSIQFGDIAWCGWYQHHTIFKGNILAFLMTVCAHQIPGWVHKSHLEQSEEIHVFASCCVMPLAVGLRMWWTRFIALGGCLKFVRISRCRCFVAHLLLTRGV